MDDPDEATRFAAKCVIDMFQKTMNQDSEQKIKLTCVKCGRVDERGAVMAELHGTYHCDKCASGMTHKNETSPSLPRYSRKAKCHTCGAVYHHTSERIDGWGIPMCWHCDAIAPWAEPPQDIKAGLRRGSSVSSILQEAEQIINGPRRESYGDVKDSFSRVALFWSEIIGTTVTPQQVIMCMMALKLCREINQPSRDNRTDLCGYAALLDKLIDSKPPEPPQSASDNG